MNKNNFIQPVAIVVIVVSVLVSGYILLKPSDQTQSQSQAVNSSTSVSDGKQVIQMTVKSVSYSPNHFTVKAGVPVRWEITSSGVPGCDSSEVVARGLTDPIYLNPEAGQITVKEFTPQTPGTYQFSCPMGMVRGTIDVTN